MPDSLNSPAFVSNEAPFRMLAHWNTAPMLTPADTPDAGVFDVASAWRFVLTYEKHHYLVDVPQGFRTDGPSVPWIFQWLVKVSGNTWAAGLIHDVGYITRGFDGVIPKEAWDKYFGLALAMCDVPPIKVAAMFEAVYRGGGRAWMDDSAIDRYNREHGLHPSVQRVQIHMAYEPLSS